MNISAKVLLGVLIICAFGACKNTTPTTTNSLDEKMAPSDFLTLRYAYPDEAPDMKGYKKAMAQFEAIKNNPKSAPGLDAPWRLEGPGNLGARINTIAAHPTNADTILIGYSQGGIFKTTNGGADWYPVFDQFSYTSISSIVYDPADENIIYAGTGDHNISGYPFVGNGIYKSTDGGESWTQMGLDATGIVSRIIVDHTNSAIIYAATMGKPFAPDNDRGLYKSADGGQSWSQILFLGDSTGVIDIAMHPVDPNIILAAGWDRIRNNSTSIISGQGAKIHRTTDGGQTWTILTNGLPQDDQSRIGLTTSLNNPGRFYAEYINPNLNVGGIYETSDAGDSWTSKSLTGLSTGAGGFAWYFGQIRVNPLNDQELYHCGINLWRSFNGGDNWGQLPNTGHVDKHDVQFDAEGNILLATDGGLYIKYNGQGQGGWIDIENIPTTQFYRVATDPFNPGTIYGGAQDNGTSFGDSANFNNWDPVLGGDGFSIVFNPVDPSISYAETQNGNIYRKTSGTGYINISFGFEPGEVKPWDMFYMLSPHDPDVVYTGAQRLYRSEAGINNDHFSFISDDLTEASTSSNATRYHFISHIDASHFVPEQLYVGTSDGLVWKKIPGELWTLINTGLPDRYVTRVVASEIDDQRLFVTHSGYKDGGLNPHIHYSENQGTSWMDISSNLPDVGINELIVLPNSGDSTLFIGTDAGVFISFNRGNSWEVLGTGFPSVPVYDMDLDLVNNRLIASTFGRSMLSYDISNISSSGLVTMAGIVKARMGQPVNNVMLAAGNQSQQTGPDGSFSLSLIPDPTCELIPTKTGPNNNGVTILDVVLLQRHLVLLDTLTHLGQFAGDVTDDENLTINDVVQIQRSIVLLDTIFPSGSWDFVPDQFVFTDPLDAFTNPIPNSLSCNDAVANPDFWAIKKGDVSGNANNMNLLESGNRSPVAIEHIIKDEISTLQINSEIAVTGFQFKIVLENDNPVKINRQIPGLLIYQQANNLTLLWSSTSGQSIRMDEPIIAFENNSVVNLSSASDFENVLVQKTASNWNLFDLYLEHDENILEVKTTFSIFPNPTSNILNINFDKPTSTEWSLMSANGLAVKNGTTQNERKIIIELPASIPTGIYFLTIGKGKHKIMERIIVN